MSHLHIPDGVLPIWLWLGGLCVSLIVVALTSRAPAPQLLAYRGALGGLMLAAMSIPMGPLDYHLTLAGPVGVLLGPAGAFQVTFVVSVILAFVGHGGFTVIGLNALVLGIAAAAAYPVYRACARLTGPGTAMAIATAAGQVVAAGLWLVVVVVALRVPLPTVEHAHHAVSPERAGWLATLAVPLWMIGLMVESAVAYGIANFLARVNPRLLPIAPEPLVAKGGVA